MKEDKNQYVLGTEALEMHRLGVQHQAWSTDANLAWKHAGFTAGMTILDLGCGPGFCTQELAYLTGKTGHVIGVDISQTYIDFLDRLSDLHELEIETICADFMDMDLAPNSLDGVYTRWALAWLPDVDTVLKKVITAMKPGATFAIQEYYDWSLLQTEPYKENLYHGTRQALESLGDLGGDINIGRRIPALLSSLGMEIISTRPMTKQARSHEYDWNWPKSFFHIYLPKLVAMGRMSQAQVDLALEEFRELENTVGATVQTPLMIEVIGKKIMYPKRIDL